MSKKEKRVKKQVMIEEIKDYAIKSFGFVKVEMAQRNMMLSVRSLRR